MPEVKPQQLEYAAPPKGEAGKKIRRLVWVYALTIFVPLQLLIVGMFVWASRDLPASFLVFLWFLLAAAVSVGVAIHAGLLLATFLVRRACHKKDTWRFGTWGAAVAMGMGYLALVAVASVFGESSNPPEYVRITASIALNCLYPVAGGFVLMRREA